MNTKRVMWAWLVAAWLPLSAHADTNATLDQLFGIFGKIQQTSKEVPEEEETAVGEQYAALLLGASGLARDESLQRYVNRVGRWLALQTERPQLAWHFGVLDSEDINAFATPGGYVFVTHGLVKQMKSEAELAGVLAHEISHVLQRHHLQAVKKAARMEIGAELLDKLLLEKQGKSEQAKKLVSGMQEVMLRGLDKDDEYEADRMGMVIAARAGYDPYGLPAVLQTLQGRNPQDSALALMFQTHPAPEARLGELERVASDRLDAYSAQEQAAERFLRYRNR
jgi:predicted Zn-dependent protease